MDYIIKSRKIREEQDAAYLESLRIDQEKVHVHVHIPMEFAIFLW